MPLNDGSHIDNPWLPYYIDLQSFLPKYNIRPIVYYDQYLPAYHVGTRQLVSREMVVPLYHSIFNTILVLPYHSFHLFAVCIRWSLREQKRGQRMRVSWSYQSEQYLAELNSSARPWEDGLCHTTIISLSARPMFCAYFNYYHLFNW